MIQRWEAVLHRVADVPQRALVIPIARVLPGWVTPNLLSASRLVLAGIVAALLSRRAPGLAALLYVVALCTDALDGGVARLRGTTSRFGARFDASVDKVLQGTVFVAFAAVAPVLVGALILLDALLFLLGVLLILRSPHQPDFSASMFGKWKLTVQALAALALFWNALVPSAALPLPVAIGLLSVALVLAVFSAMHYIQRWSAAFLAL